MEYYRKLADLSGVPVSPDKLKLTKLGDLLYHEGPLLSHWVNETNENYLMAWCDVDDIFNRWLIHKTTANALMDFFGGISNLRDLLLQNPDGYVYFVDIDGNIDWKRAWKVRLEDIDPEYLPGDESGFEESGFEPYALELKAHLEHHFKDQPESYKPKHEPAAVAMEPQTDYKTPPKE